MGLGAGLIALFRTGLARLPGRGVVSFVGSPATGLGTTRLLPWGIPTDNGSIMWELLAFALDIICDCECPCPVK